MNCILHVQVHCTHSVCSVTGKFTPVTPGADTGLYIREGSWRSSPASMLGFTGYFHSFASQDMSETLFIKSHNCLLFTKLWLLKNLTKTLLVIQQLLSFIRCYNCIYYYYLVLLPIVFFSFFCKIHFMFYITLQQNSSLQCRKGFSNIMEADSLETIRFA